MRLIVTVWRYGPKRKMMHAREITPARRSPIAVKTLIYSVDMLYFPPYQREARD